MISSLKLSAVEHPIKSVTVFKSKAEVVRTFALELKAGQSKVEITGLPSCIDTDSIRVSGLGQARLCDVVCTIGDQSDSHEKDSPTETIRLLKKKKTELFSQKTMLETLAEIHVAYGKTLTGEHINPSDMSHFLDNFVEQSQKNLTALSSLSEEIVIVDRLIVQETAKLLLKRGRSTGEVSVVIGTDEDGSVELKLTYIVDNASWEPAYELHARTENGKALSAVSLHYRARVNQTTGEDWTDTALTLSTVASDTATRSIPHLKPVKIRPQPGKPTFTFNENFVPGNWAQQQQPMQKNIIVFGQQQQQQQQVQQQQMPQQQASLFGPAGFGGGPGGGAAFGNRTQASPFGNSNSNNSGGGLFGAATGAPPPPEAESGTIESPEEEDAFERVGEPAAFLEPTTVVSESPLAISYAVESKSTIPSDGVSHQVSVAVLPFETKITHVTAPRVQPNVYLQCEVKNTSEYRLLPGPVTVILDDSFVSKTSIQDINTGDTFICTLGVDPATKVSYTRSVRTVRSAAGTFAEAFHTTTYTSKIIIHNKHAFAISELVVRDVVPTCEDKRVRVILRKPEGLADAKDGQVVDLKKDGLKVGWEKIVDGKGGEKEGRFEWLWKVDAGSQVKLEAEWEVKAPDHVKWVESVFN